jgi:hypothetical protein
LLAGRGVAQSGDVYALGDVRPGPASSLMEFGGDLIFGSRARLQIEIGGLLAGPQHDALVVAQRAELDGLLEITPLMAGGLPFEPQPGDRFRILEAGSVHHQFAHATIAGFAPGLKFNLEYRANEVVLAATAYFSADFDLDGRVDHADLAAWNANYGASSATHAQGDADGNGAIDGADLLAWQMQLGSSLKPAALATQAIPEPASGAMAAWLFIAALAARRAARS